MAGSSRVANSSAPNFSERSAQAETAPGTVTLSHPRAGIRSRPANRSGVHAAGERPDALSPCRVFPSQTMAKASLPNPLPVGSTTVRVAAAARAASTALPPLASMESPAWAASGREVASMLRARTGRRGAPSGMAYERCLVILPSCYGRRAARIRAAFERPGIKILVDRAHPAGRKLPFGPELYVVPFGSEFLRHCRIDARFELEQTRIVGMRDGRSRVGEGRKPGRVHCLLHAHAEDMAVEIDL